MSVGEDKSVVQVLREAKAKIAEPGAWAQGFLAYSECGDVVDPYDPQATCWCALGAASAVACPAPVLSAAGAALNQAARKRWGMSVVHFNDHPDTTHEMVLSAYDNAIALAESEAA